MKVLLVIDMQNDFINGSLGSPAAEAIVDKVVEKMLDFDGTILCTKDTHMLDYMSTLEGKKLPVPHCIYDTTGWQLNEKIEEARRKKSGDTLTKFTFGSLSLFEGIAESIESIEICGLCTDICVVSNALIARATFPNVPITVDASCCAGTTPEKHKAALEVMKSCQIDVINEVDS